MRRYLSVVVVGTFLLACGRGKLTPGGAVVEVSPAEAVKLIRAGGILVLDVRTMEEYKRGHISPSLLVPYQEVRENREKIASYGLPILVYCRSGRRSLIAANELVELGFRKVYNLKGGKKALLLYLDEHPEYKDLWCTEGCPGICKGGCGCPED